MNVIVDVNQPDLSAVLEQIRLFTPDVLFKELQLYEVID